VNAAFPHPPMTTYCQTVKDTAAIARLQNTPDTTDSVLVSSNISSSSEKKNDEVHCQYHNNNIHQKLHGLAKLRPHSIILATCKPGFQPVLQPGFRQVCVGLRHAFDQHSTSFCRKSGHESQQVRWLVHVLDKWNVEKNPF